ncbi:MAG TPA: hypothetical protein VK671_10070, partial [Mucilaginibacter sp.]|nr:hypothetical protein [Mucilaginibacter sp.]
MKRIFAVSLLTLFAVIFCDRVFAQDKKLIPLTKYPQKDTAVKVTADTSQQKDLGDVLQSIFTKNYKPAKLDTIGRKPIISFVPAVGYSLQTELAATLTGNIVFRPSPGSKISSITTSMGYTQKRQFTLPIVSTIWTRNNEYVFLGDTRFYIYPQATYGLGSNSAIDDKERMRYNLFRFSEVVMRHVAGDFFLGAGYKLQQHWNITHGPTKDGDPSDYDTYGSGVHTISSGLSLNALFDSRDNSVNASKGFYGAVQYYNYQKFLGSNNNWQSIVIDVRKYYRFPGQSDNVVAFWSYD